MITQKNQLSRLIVTVPLLLFIVSCNTDLIDKERGDYLKIPAQGTRESPSDSAFELSKSDLPFIILSDNPTHSAIIAARELQIHIEKVLGAFPRITFVSDSTIDSDAKRIYVGMSEAELENGIPSTFESEQYITEVNPNSIFLVGQDDESVRATDLFSLSDGQTGKALELDGQTLYSTDKFDNEGFNSRGGSIAFWLWIDDGLDTTQVVISMGKHLISVTPSTDSGSGNGSTPVPPQATINYVVYRDPANQDPCHRLFTKVTSDPVDTNAWHRVFAWHKPSTDSCEPNGHVGLRIDEDPCEGRGAINDNTDDESILLIGGWGEDDEDRFEGRIDNLRISSIESPGQALDPCATPQPSDSNSTDLVSMDFDEPFNVPLNDGTFEESILPLLESIHHNHGTLLAAYEFLEEYLQVRWYAPTELGTSIIERSTIDIPCGTVVRKPGMEYRLFAAPLYLLPPNYDENLPEGIAISDYEQELFRYRMRLGGKPFNAAHAFRHYWDHFGTDSSSESWFAKENAGQMCYLNQGLRDQIVEDAVIYFNSNKSEIPPCRIGTSGYVTGVEGDCFSITPNDVAILYEEDCNQVAEDTPKLFSNDTASEMIWDFANEIATEVYERLEPEVQESARVCMAAYKQYAYPPADMYIHPMITPKIALVYPRSEYSEEIYENDLSILKAWRDALGPDRTIYVHFYYLTPVLAGAKKNYFPFPGMTPRSTVAFWDLLREFQVSGYYIEHSSQGRLTTAGKQYPYRNAENPNNLLRHASYLIDQVDLYLFSRLAFDPTADGKELIDEFFDRYYHGASHAMRSFYSLVEDTCTDSERYDEKESLESAFTSNLLEKKPRCCIDTSHGCLSCAVQNCCLSCSKGQVQFDYTCIRKTCFRNYYKDTEFSCIFEDGKPYGIAKINDWENVGTEGVMHQLDGYLLKASGAVAEDPIAQERLDLFATTVWCPMVNEYNLAASTYGRPGIDDTVLCSTIRKKAEK